MIIPFINAMTLKTGEPTKISADSQRFKPGVQRPKRSAAKTGFLLMGALMVAATMLRMARRRPR
ncbi:hypothetical protein [Actinomadura sp. HBU206391]|uniref:hypothetical protein n=1 Tax=Actinomadura sp. HBU206391 TaxID=2731692 RepID=UPI001650C3FF|nr:hypothetical protein [Actinomadura sp. HBU206391]MBC6462111.1 hypothetical protein [Actinomadura sp. HBU206391]